MKNKFFFRVAYVGIIVLFCLTIGMISLTIAPVSASNNMSLSPAFKLSQTTPLENNKVYFIKNQRSGLYLDISGEWFTDKRNVQQYPFNGTENQKFKVTNLTNDEWTITPMCVSSRRLDISGGSAENEVPVQTYESNGSTAQRIRILNDGNGTLSFVMLTAVSNFQSCITVKNASYTQAPVIQYHYENHGNTDNDHWYFELCDETLNVNTLQQSFVGVGCHVDYHLGPFTDGYNIVVETRGSVDTKIEMRNKSGNIYAQSDDDGDGLNAKIVFPYIDYPSSYGVVIRVSAYGSHCGVFEIACYVEEEYFFNSYFKLGDLNTRSEVQLMQQHFSTIGAVVFEENNSSLAYMKTVDSVNKRSKFDRRFYCISSHGGSGGSVRISPTEVFYGADLPDMSHCDLAVWDICYGGLPGNVAQIAAWTKHAKWSLGWPDTIYSNEAFNFTDKFYGDICYYIEKGGSFNNLNYASYIQKAVNFVCPVFTDSSICHPIAYRSDGTKIVFSPPKRTRQMNGDKLTILKEDTGEKYTFKLINGIVTNEYFVEKDGASHRGKVEFTQADKEYCGNAVNVSVRALPLEVTYDSMRFYKKNVSLRENYILKYNGELYFIEQTRAEYVTDDGFSYGYERFIDLNTGREFSRKEVESMFGGEFTI